MALQSGLTRYFRFVLPLAVASAAAAPETSLRSLVETGRLDDLRWPNFSPIKSQVASFYESNSHEPGAYEPVWTRQGQPTQQARALIAMFENAERKGLNPEDYDGSRWEARLAYPRAVTFDLALSVSAMRYVSDLRIGRVNPKIFCFGLDTQEKACDLAGILRELVSSGDTAAAVDGLEPPFPGYRRTEQALERYLQLAKIEDGEPLPATKKPIKPGDAYPDIARLEHRLRLLGDLPAGLASGFYTYAGPLVDAVKHLQARHGLDPDGWIGPATLEQLNTPLKQRVRQLKLTLERWRWVPTDFARPPIVVNIPAFRLHALNERYETELEMKVVVGGAYRHQTPVFTNRMTYLIFRPYWNVPLSIQRAELVPKIAKDPAYLAANDYEIVDAGGQTITAAVDAQMLAQLRAGKLEIRQKPGPLNALGFVKFLFPNEYNVYLHGTPAKALFGKSRRDFSHGCIRVEKPEELAAWVLRDQPQWTRERIREVENGSKTVQVNLLRPIPVLIVYGTAVVSASGDVSFFDDIYGHDKSLDEVLAHGYPYSGWQPPVSPDRRD